MLHVLAIGILFGILTEERVPAEGYECLIVKYQNMLYVAKKFERTRLTGNVSLTMPVDSLEAILDPNKKGRVIELSGYEAVTDSLTCSCQLRPQPCVDK